MRELYRHVNLRQFRCLGFLGFLGLGFLGLGFLGLGFLGLGFLGFLGYDTGPR
jgi:hypothetical protein